MKKIFQVLLILCLCVGYPHSSNSAMALRQLSSLERGPVTIYDFPPNSIPQFSVQELHKWVEMLPKDGPLYGWLLDLSKEDLSLVLSVAAEAYRSFGKYMCEAAEYIRSERTKATLHVQTKADKSVVTNVENKVQARINEIIRASATRMAGIGEEESVGEAGEVRFLVFSDPVDGTNNYIRRVDHPRAGYYFSPLTVAYRDKKGALHPLLTIAAMPEFTYRGIKGLMFVTGLGIDTVYVNGQKTQKLSQDASLSSLIASTVVLAGTGKRRYNEEVGKANTVFRRALEETGHPFGQTRGESENTFQCLIALLPENPGQFTGLQPTAPSALWDALPGIHIFRAMGGEVYDMTTGEPFRVTPDSLDGDGKTPPLLYCASKTAAKELFRHILNDGDFKEAVLSRPTAQPPAVAVVPLTSPALNAQLLRSI